MKEDEDEDEEEEDKMRSEKVASERNLRSEEIYFLTSAYSFLFFLTEKENGLILLRDKNVLVPDASLYCSSCLVMYERDFLSQSNLSLTCHSYSCVNLIWQKKGQKWQNI